jgi:alpha-tubulin suppressor-like RCC1 family protein
MGEDNVNRGKGSGLPLTRIWLLVVTSMAILAVAPAASHAEGGAAAVAWGQNLNTELGSGYKDTYEAQPVPVVGLGNITAVAAGSQFSLALLSTGEVRAWGKNDFGQLGDGMGPEGENWLKLENNVTVIGLAHVKAISAAGSHALALLENGTVEAWGNDFYGEAGNETAGRSEPLAATVPLPSEAIAIASGGGSNYALLSNHTVMAWGENGNGQLGIGETGPQTECHGKRTLCSWTPHIVGTPVLNEKGEPVRNEQGEPQVTPLTNVASIAAGEEAAYAVLENGHVMAWGANTSGQLGTGAEPLRINFTPEQVKTSSGEALSNVEAVSGGQYDALALLKTGKVDGWGRSGGELGEVEGAETCLKEIACIKEARQIKGLENVTDVSAGEGYSLAVSGKEVYSFGVNEQGTLGNGGTSNSYTPAPIKGLGNVTAVAAGVGSSGISHSIALLEAGVSAPAPLLKVEPGSKSVKVAWTLPAKEYELLYRRWNAAEEECEESNCTWLGIVKLGAHGEKVTDPYEFTGLEAGVPYLFVVKSHNGNQLEKKRMIVGTPLP